MVVKKETFKYPCSIIEESERFERFLSLLKTTTIKLLSDINNYTSSFECKICHEEIRDHTNIDHLHLYTEDREHFMTFHFRCALKHNTGEKFSDIADNFEYVFYINDKHNKGI